MFELLIVLAFVAGYLLARDNNKHPVSRHEWKSTILIAWALVGVMFAMFSDGEFASLLIGGLRS